MHCLAIAIFKSLRVKCKQVCLPTWNKYVSLYMILYGRRYRVGRTRKNFWKIWTECRLMFSSYNSPSRTPPSVKPPLSQKSTMSYKKQKIS